MNKKEELKKQLGLARREVCDVKSDLAKLDQNLNKKVSENRDWIEAWSETVKGLRKSFAKFRAKPKYYY